MDRRHCPREHVCGSCVGESQKPRNHMDGEQCEESVQENMTTEHEASNSKHVPEAHQCLFKESPSCVRLSTSSYCHMNRSNGQLPPHGSAIHTKCCHCNHQESKLSYTVPQLPGHEDRTLSSRHSSGNIAAESSHQTTDHCTWKQWGNIQRTTQPLQHHVVTVRHNKAFRIPTSYSQLITEWPLPILAICLFFMLVCTLAGLLVGQMPDFSNPLMQGFEPRDTEIGRRLITWKNIQSHTGYRKLLSVYPHGDKNSLDDLANNRRKEKLFQITRNTRYRRMVEQKDGVDGFFCGPPAKSYSQLVFMSKTAGSLWNLQAIQSMCRMEKEKIHSHSSFSELCERNANKECCPSWSLGNYISALYNRSSCMEITQNDIAHTLVLLRSCAPDYHRGALTPSCIGSRLEREKHSQCAKVPEKCTRSSAVYQLLHFLVDRDFLSPQTTNYQVPSLKYSLLFLPVKKGSSLMDIYLDNLESWDLFDNYTAITGMELGLKQKLFQHYLVLDTVYPVLAIVAIFLSISFYLRSFFITFMVLMSVVGSLLISFFLYKLVFRITFFPFVNLISVIILSSICANHTFVFFDLWKLSKIQHSAAGMLQWVKSTMHQFGYLMLVSCLTTGAAFYACYLSSITSVRCFAIYMGTSVLVNMIFMLTWLPATMVLYEKYIRVNCSYKSDYWNSNGHKQVFVFVNQKLGSIQRTLSETSKLLFEKLLPCGVIKFRYIWICWFAALAAGGGYIACMNPKLKLPSTVMSSVQMFRLSHPFERYDAEYCHQFMFEHQEHGEGQQMSVTLIWGIMPVDNGDHLNQKINEMLIKDTSFTIFNADNQRWLLDLCHKVRNQSFYYSDQDKKPNICFMEDFHRWMESRQCSQSDQNHNLCCNQFVFPYAGELLLHCIKMMVREQGGDRPDAYDMGARFDASGNLTALVLEFPTFYHYSFNYSKSKTFYNTVNQWLTGELKNAPQGLRNGWFTSNLALFNLQHTLSTEIMMITGFSVAISFVLLLLTTWNVLLSLFSVAAIGGSVLVTDGLLVLLEWQLNVLESLFVSAAAGLSVDFTVNYCISYHLCPHSDRLSRVAYSLKQMSCATAMGASTMFSTGVIMLPATVLPYRKLGIFIMMIKCISCGFASFFFQSLCCFFGPEKNCGQILWSCSNGLKDSDDLRSNGAFACGGNEKQIRLRKSQESNTDNEQYELQPLARNLSDSFDNSTTTSKLSKRPSILSEDMQLSESKFPRAQNSQKEDQKCPDSTAGHKVFSQCPALQTSSPYRKTNFGSEMEESKELCLCQRLNSKTWNDAMVNQVHVHNTQCPSHTNSMQSPKDSDFLHTPANRDVHLYEYSRCLCSVSSSFDAVDSNETYLSDFDQSSKLADSTNCSPDFLEVPDSPCHGERGHLNGKRETLRLALRETVFDSPSSNQTNILWKINANQDSSHSVVLPNSKPDMPDVWIKRTSEQNSGFIS